MLPDFSREVLEAPVPPPMDPCMQTNFIRKKFEKHCPLMHNTLHMWMINSVDLDMVSMENSVDLDKHVQHIY